MIPFPAVGVTRPNFLVLTPICVSLGLASVLLSGQPVEWGLLAVVLLGAVMAHVSVNALNEYADYLSGLDFKTERTPFSGGSGTLVLQPRLANQALVIGVASLVITLLCGIYLMQHVGWGLAPVGLLGMAIILSYTWINRHRVLVLLAPGLGFGPLMVMGTDFALTGEYRPQAFALSLIPFFLVNNLLLLNQFPDVEPDRSVGRDNYAIALTTRGAAWIYLAFAVAAYAVVLLGVAVGWLPWPALLGLLPAWLSYEVFRGAHDYNGEVPTLIPYLGRNVVATLATPLLVTIGIVAGSLW